MRRVFGQRRAVQPSLSGFTDSAECVLTGGFIPRAVCDRPADAPDEAVLDALWEAFDARLVDRPTRDELHGMALLRLAAGPDSLNEVRRAIGDLGEALGSTDDSATRAELLTDLAAANLLLAEELQSPVEVGAALEAALEAVELAPMSPEARFNQRLAELLLGILRTDQVAEQVADDPDLVAIARALAAEPSGAPAAPADPGTDQPTDKTTGGAGPAPCLPARELRSALDRWVDRPTPESWELLAEQRQCLADAEDRFFPDVLAAAEREPDRLAASWRHYQGLERAAGALDSQALRAHLDALASDTSVAVVRRAGDYFAVFLSYQQENYSAAEALLERHRAEVEASGYPGLTVRALSFLAFIAQLRGELGSALARLEQAEAINRRFGIEALTAKLEMLRSELDTVAGREYDGWRSQVLALRRLTAEPLVEQRVGALGLLAEQARLRGFERLALHLRDRAVSTAEGGGPGARITSLRARGETLARLGRLAEARRDLEAARALLTSSPDELMAHDSLAADLDYLEGLAAEEPATRRAALERTRERYRSVGYDLRILGVEHALALIEAEEGEPETAIRTLEEAFDELTEQVAATTRWSEATALVEAARPVIDALVGLELDHRPPEDVLRTIGRYLGLRSRPDPGIEPVGLVEGPRLTTFVRATELVLLVEAGGSLTIVRQPVERQHLVELRGAMLARARAIDRRARFWAALEPLAGLVLDPVVKNLAPYETAPLETLSDEPGILTVVADDVLAGLPFHLFSHGGEGELLLDHWAVRYATDLRSPASERIPTRLLASGSAGEGSGLRMLAEAEDEARAVAALYPDHHLLLGAEASPVAVRSWLFRDDAQPPTSATFDALHIASHFEADPRRPLESTLVLAPPFGDAADAASRRLSLGELLAHAPAGLDLLYLSACDTGLGIASETHGLHSLAQAFGSSGVRHTVLTLWPLDDAIGASIARRFHELLTSGHPAVQALRRAQLEHREEHPVAWGALVVVE